MTKPHCKICGSTKTLDEKSDEKYPSICQYQCNWTVEGWIGWNARLGKVHIGDARAVALFQMEFPPRRLTYPKTIATARAMGWQGRENAVGTF